MDSISNSYRFGDVGMNKITFQRLNFKFAAQPTMTMNLFLWLIIISYIGSQAHALTILSPPDLAAELNNTNSPILPQFLASFDPIGPINLVLESQAAATNSCVVLFPPQGISVDLAVKRLWKIGVSCIVVVASTFEPGVGTFLRDQSDPIEEVNIPVVEISPLVGAILERNLKNGTLITVLITDSDPNPWDLALSGTLGTIRNILIGVPAIINVLIALYKMTAHVRTYGCKTSIAQIIFWIDISANLLRIWYGVISRGFYLQIMYLFTTMTSTMSWPLNIISVLLVGIKWHELTTANNLKPSLFLSRHRKPFLIASAIIFLIELISSALRGLYFSIALLAGISWSLLVITTAIVVIILWTFGFRVLRHLAQVRESGAVSGGSTSMMTSMRAATIGMMVAGGFLLIPVVAFIVLAISTARGLVTLTVSYGVIVATLVALNVASFIQLISFPTPSRQRNEFGKSIQSDGTVELTNQTAPATLSGSHTGFRSDETTTKSSSLSSETL